ncbi:hypothetical protein ACTG9Q_13830 [Actinokineospora sp. 24-640]
MTAPRSRTEAADAFAEITRLQALARAAGVSFAFPLRLYGAAGIISAALLATLPIQVYNLWWLTVAATAPVLVAHHYHRRLSLRGVGISRGRAGRYAAGTELLAAALWFAQPLYPIPISAPWLAFALGATLVARAWHDRPLAVIAAAVAATVTIAAAAHWPMPATDLLIGTLLCLGSTCPSHHRRRIRAMLPPAWPT